MKHLLIYEDQYWPDLEPLTLTRPACLVRCGAGTLLEHIQSVAGAQKITITCRPRFAVQIKADLPGIAVNRLPKTPFYAVNGSWLMDAAGLRQLLELKPNHTLRIGNRIVAARVDSIPASGKRRARWSATLLEDWPSKSIHGNVIQYPWDLVHLNKKQMKAAFIKPAQPAVAPPGAVFVHPERIRLGANVQIDPGVVLDATGGPIVMADDVHVMPQAVILGPAYLGRGTLVRIGARLYAGVSAGPVCKIGCEVSNSIIHGYSNVQHDGYLGNSYVGEWVNVGAGTITSDLKNTYGYIRVPTHQGYIDTHSRSVGSMIGDHSKIGIAGLLNSGSIIGIHCNLFGTGFQPRHVPSFAWGGQAGFAEYRFDKAVSTAKRMMKRRGRNLSAEDIAVFRKVFDESEAFRVGFLATAANR
jgi:UDP-N-acetylglucosamine diphosphorylase / glucose-1-phosphate thymidylyltransferase / UDP-N-acetylgalactosamine diphosphorylase / glucosamine-1-phosphate N-acetyltransferase / galactosamine-1-phosphate N-acetyltransferase